MKYTYKTENTCATKISFELHGDVVSNVEFQGGCPGNLKAIQRFVEGYTVDQIEQVCKGNMCGRRPTSCTDQLAVAVRQAYERSGE
ncbi:MAG: TIGR03905 family TSCPD domain-containing protein [Oscillospiraceae bacterium]|jgi:uncharacterized protein (TIGR03905 family)|nr:TIGR03905 family TSCPD domain-containing protein [Oscillospiraceae bacterium]